MSLTFEKGHIILYSRYTMTSAHISVIPEILEKIEMNGAEKFFNIAKSDITNTLTSSQIMFRGIKTSSGNQTAKLKSIQGLTTFVVDEAEEWVSETDYEKIMLSIRQKDIQNRIIIIMNPTDVNHFIYRKYIANTHKIVEIDGVPVQISTHPNVLHIHTSYFDNLEHLGDEFLKEIDYIKENSPKKYAHTVIGQWADIAEGVIFKNWEIVECIPSWAKKNALAMDFGYTNDETGIVECAMADNDLYIDEICYKTHLLTKDIVCELRPYSNKKVISESADPRLIQEIKNAGINIYPVEKYAGSIIAGIEKMLELNLKVTKRSYNVMNEFRNYVWDKDKDGKFINFPKQGGKDHLCDAVRYYVLMQIIGQNRRRQNLEGIFY
jgi:phage terminase large subunit